MPVKQRTKTLQSRKALLADSFYQLKVLNTPDGGLSDLPPFEARVAEAGHAELRPGEISILQVNIGKKCNQSCAHCHVDAGPDRTEMMSPENLSICLAIACESAIETVDITGGAPELHPHFKWFVEKCRENGKKIINRCNLTIILANRKFHALPGFFAKNQVHLISSLPHFSKLRTDSQRGVGAFESSIEALRMLNDVGYGMEGSGLEIDLVYNPTGHFLPAGQKELESEFKRQLARKYGIRFNKLFTITNMPISRFLDYLLETGNYEDYMQKLIDAFNPATIDGLMCRNTLSIGWDGTIYDCDFNQMLEMKVNVKANHIAKFNWGALRSRKIALGQHCYGCTAGSGSSCGGEIA